MATERHRFPGLGLNVLDEVTELLPAGGNKLVMIGDVDIEQRAGPTVAVRRILPRGALDPRFGLACRRPPLAPARSRGGAVTRDGGVLVTATKFLIHARPRRTDSVIAPYNTAGCPTARRLRVRGVHAGPPLLQSRRRAIVGASYEHGYDHGGLALIRIRR
jgi:hypothetical protein